MKHATWFLFALLAVGCSDGGEDPALPDGGYDCDVEMRDEMFVAGMEKVADDGTVFVLVDSEPAPPAKGNNLWTLEITDADGNPVDVGATSAFTDVCDGSGDPSCESDLILDPFMPDHGHGTSVTAEVKASGTAGTYEVQKVNLFMAGYWEITVGTKTHGEVTFKFCVSG